MGIDTAAGVAEDARSVATAAEDRLPEVSAFDRVRAYIADHIGAVRQVQAGQQSAEELLGQAEDELGALKREFDRARLSHPAKTE